MKRIPRQDRAGSHIVLALICLYAPYGWLVLMGGAWNSYRWHWVRMWPVLPGLLVHTIPGVHQFPDGMTYALMAVATSGILALMVLVLGLSRNRQTAGLVSLIVATLSGVNAWIAYELYWW